MLILPGDRIQVARLFNFFLQGEQLAFDCALRQSQIFPDDISRRFFATQARQEKFHARVFRCGIGILAPKGIGRFSKNAAMESYRNQLESALAGGDLALSLLGMQIILEGLGDVALQHISDGCGPRGIGFSRIRRMALGQEDAHHNFGIRRFLAFFAGEAEAVETNRTHFDDYYGQLQNIIESVAPLFEHFDEDPLQYLKEFESSLPEFFQPESTPLKVA